MPRADKSTMSPCPGGAAAYSPGFSGISHPAVLPFQKMANQYAASKTSFSAFSRQTLAGGVSGSGVVQALLIDKLDVRESQYLKQLVREGEYQQVLDFLMSKLPPTGGKRGNTPVKAIHKFTTLPGITEEPKGGGQGATIGGAMYGKEDTGVYISQARIRQWVLGDQIGNLVSLIEHELTHAHQRNDPSFIKTHATNVADRDNAMEFEAYAQELRGVYVKLEAIGFDDDRADTAEFPTEAHLIQSFNTMEEHYYKMGPENKKRYERQMIIHRGRFEVMRDYISRNFTPRSLLDTFLYSSQSFAYAAHTMLRESRVILRTCLRDWTDAKTAYDKVRDEISAPAAERRERSLINEDIRREAKKRDEATDLAIATMGTFYTNWEAKRLEVYKDYNRMNTLQQKQYEVLSELYNVLGPKPPVLGGVAEAQAYHRGLTIAWNKKVLVCCEVMIEKKKPVNFEPYEIEVPQAMILVEQVKQEDQQQASPKSAQLKGFKRLLQHPYAKHHLERVAPEGLDKLSVPLLRINSIAATQGAGIYDKIVKILSERTEINIAPDWYKNMSPTQLWDMYTKLSAD